MKKEIRKLKIEKAALFGFLDAIIDYHIPGLKKREEIRNKIGAFKFIRPIDLTEEI